MITDTTPRLVVLGDIILDYYVHGKTTRINPEAPVPVVDVTRESHRLGGAANVANNLLSLGARVSLLSVVGDDEPGRKLRAALVETGIPSDGIVVAADRQTTVKNRIVVENQQIARVDWETRAAIDADTERRLCEQADRLIDEADAVLISDYDKGVVTEAVARHVIAACRRANVPVLVDPKRRIEKFRGATLLKPNLKEAREMTGSGIEDDQQLQAAGQQLRQSLQLERVMITLSERGFALVGEEMLKCPAAAGRVVDVTGAGDTTLAALGWALAAGRTFEDAARTANLAASISVGKFGAACVTEEELREYEASVAEDTNIHTVAELARISRGLQAEGQRVVFTNGCFDVLHVGHVAYLKESRRCGDVLVVGINSDASVRRLKGPDRPMFDEGERSRIVAALTPVDYVFVFDEDTPYEAIRTIRPDVLTKGDDYKYEDVVGNDLVDDVRLIPLVRGKSSTNAIGRIQKAS